MKVTAKELIEELQKVPGDTEVSFQMDDGCCGDFMDTECGLFRAIEWYGSFYFELRISAVPGYRSCIEAGSTKRRFERTQEPAK